MPALKKKPSGKTTITLYAQEERQIQGAIETLKFIEINGDGPLQSNCGVLNSGLAAVLKMLEPPPPKQKGKDKPTPLIPDDDKPKPF